MAKNVIIGQSGGPTAVINSSLACTKPPAAWVQTRCTV